MRDERMLQELPIATKAKLLIPADQRAG